VKNERSYTSIPPVCLHGIEKENFTFNNDQKVIGSIPGVYIRIATEIRSKKRALAKILISGKYATRPSNSVN
jgi:hypothetical protein